MGEAYRGLTIRIGADTSKLQTAMSGLNRAASSIESSFRKIKSQLAADSSNTRLMAANMKVMEERTQAAAAQFAKLNAAQRQLGQTAALGKPGATLAEYASQVKNSALAVEKATSKYNNLNMNLEAFYRSYAKVMSGFKSGEAFDQHYRDIKKLAQGYAQGGEAAQKFRNAIKSAAMSKAFDDPLGIGKTGVAQGNAYAAAITRIKDSWIATEKEMEGLKQVDGFKAIERDAMLAESKIRSMAIETVKAESEMRQLRGTTSGGIETKMEAAANSMRSFEDSAKAARAVVSTMDDALRMDPSSMGAAKAKMAGLRSELANITGAATAARERLAQIGDRSADVAALTAKYGSLEGAIKTVSSGLAEARVQANAFGEQLKEAQNRESLLGKIDKSSEQYRAAAADVDRFSTKVNEAKKRVNALETEMRQVDMATAFRDTTNELTRFNAQARATSAAMQPSIERISRYGQSIRTMGYGLYSTITPAIMMTGMYMVNAANDIDAAYRDMRKTVNGTEADFVHLKEAAIEYSRSHVTTAKDMLEIEAIGGQLGVQVQNLEKFGQVVSNLDIATNLDTETISANLGQLSAIMKDMDQSLQSGPGSMEAFSDALVRLGNNSATQEDKIMNVMMRIASMGTISGMATPDLLALSTAVAATGQGSEAAGTAISKTFSNIEGAVSGGAEALAKFGPVAEMNGEELAEYQEAIEGSAGKLEKFAEVSGMTAQQFAESWKNTPTEAFTAFIQGLKNIDESGGSVDQTLTELGITSVRQKQTLMGLTNTIGNMNDYLTMSNDAWKGVSDQWGNAGDAMYEAQQKSQGFSGQLAILKNNAIALAEEAAQGLVGPMQVLTGVFQGLTGAVQGMPDWFKTLAVSAVAAAGAMGPLAVAIGSSLDGMAKISRFMGKGKDAWKAVTKSSAESAEGMMLMATAANASGGMVERLGTKVFDAGSKVASSGGKFAKFGGMLESIGLGIVSLSGPQAAVAVASVIALGAAVGVLAGEYDRWKTRQDNLVKSTSGMLTATQSTIAMMESGSSKVREYGQAQVEASKSLDDFAASQAAHTDAVNQIKDSYEEQLVTLNTAQQYLEQYAGKTNLSAQEQGKLKAAIEWVNEACGTQYSVVDAANGIISDSSGNYDAAKSAAGEYKNAILDLIEAKKAEAKVEAYSDMLKEQTKAQADATKQLASARSERAQAIKELGELEKAGVNGGVQWEKAYEKVAEANNKVVDSTNALNATNEALEETGRAMGDAVMTVNEASGAWKTFETSTQGGFFATYIQQLGYSMSDFRKSADEAGISVETFSQMSEDNLMTLADAYNGTTGSIVSSLQGMGVELKHISEIQIGDKTYHLNDDGSIAWQEGQLEDLRAFQIGDKRFYVTDDGTVYNSMGQVQDLNALGIDPKLWYTDDGGTTRLKKEEVAQLNAESIDNKDFWVTAYDNATSTLSSIKSALDGIQSKTVDIVTNWWNNTITGKHAWGGPFSDSRTIAHAAGGYFVDRPTVIGRSGNVTHIAGEAGREFVSTHANGGVVLPLTDPYMRPWVSAVAQQMGGMGGTSITFVVNGAENPEQFARQTMRKVGQIQRAR
jgi:TP901 family phage tail tape measure protein